MYLARGEKMDEQQERRATGRIGRSEGAMVEIVECDNCSLIGQSFHCQTVDISESGLQLSLPGDLPEGSLISICISIQGSPCKYFLKGEARHCRLEEGSYRVGVEFEKRQSADQMSWLELFA